MPVDGRSGTDRVALARRIIEFDGAEGMAPALPTVARLPGWGIRPRTLDLGWPRGTAPTPRPLAKAPRPSAPLPRADYLVITWTVAEAAALADVLTPGHDRRSWYPYRRSFGRYLPKIREGAPARELDRLGSWFPTEIAGRPVLCFKSDLHLNQDGVRTGPGTATLPIADLLQQLIAEVKPKLVITEGTAGATHGDHGLGDVMVTRAARFLLDQEFRNEPWNGRRYASDFSIPKRYLAVAGELIAARADLLREPDFGPPTRRYPNSGRLLRPTRRVPRLWVEGANLPSGTPILTTDYFEFGTSTNGLEKEGCAVEMGDAVVGMVAAGMGASAPRWLSIRNASDPQINGALPDSPSSLDMQAHWAVWYYETFGYATSVGSAIASWAIIAGD